MKSKKPNWEDAWQVPLPPGGSASPALVDLGLTPDEPVRGCLTRMYRDDRTYGHMHLALQAMVVLEGQVELDLGQGWRRFDKGHGRASGSLEAHRWRVVSREMVEFRFEFLPSLFSQMPNLKGFDPSAVFRSPSRWSVLGETPAMRKSLLAIGREFARKYEQPISPGEVFIDLMRFLDVLGRTVTPGPAAEPAPWSDLAGVARIRPALERIEQSYGQRVSAEDAARVCHMSRSTFDRLFKQMTGFSYAHFALRSRIAEAARALKFGETSVKAVAHNLGFTDSSHFCHAFTAEYGMTPAQYRVACEEDALAAARRRQAARS